MKRLFNLILSIAVVFTFTACVADTNQSDTSESETTSQIPSASSPIIESSTAEESITNGNSANSSVEIATMPTISIRIGDQSFHATLYDNPSVDALLEELPITLDMSELNGNEKYFYFSKNLPSAGVHVNEIQSGDLMLYGSDCLVLFYESFSPSYNYTPLGRIEEPEGLAEALGSGNVSITFEIKN